MLSHLHKYIFGLSLATSQFKGSTISPCLKTERAVSSQSTWLFLHIMLRNTAFVSLGGLKGLTISLFTSSRYIIHLLCCHFTVCLRQQPVAHINTETTGLLTHNKYHNLYCKMFGSHTLLNVE